MKKILVVEDESIIAMELAEHLTEMGYEVVGRASSGVEAIAKAKELRPDLILMDIVMPGEKNGIEASKEIKSELDIPVIFVTAYADEEHIKSAKTVGPFGYIVKPYEDRELRAGIEVALYKKEMDSKLKEEKNRVELLTDILGHDIRNLNQVTVSYMELLLEMPDFPDKFKKYVKNAFEQSKGISKLVSNAHKLLNIQKQGLELKNIDVFPLFIRAIDEVKTTYSQKEIEIKYKLSENEVVVLGNELLEDTFYNILDNAVKYDRHDKVEVEVNIGKAEDGKYWRIEFKDNGPGIPDEIKENILTRLEREDKRAFATGLGLMLVKQIVEKYGGKVWVEDRVEGNRTKGSIFIVMLQRMRMEMN